MTTEELHVDEPAYIKMYIYVYMCMYIRTNQLGLESSVEIAPAQQFKPR